MHAYWQPYTSESSASLKLNFAHSVTGGKVFFGIFVAHLQ
jgi:hypothetical protein